MYKRRPLYFIMVALMALGLGGFLLVGCSGSSDPFGKMAVTSNVSSVNLYLDINDSGNINTSSSIQKNKVTFTVTGAPKTVSGTVTARSFDKSIATVEVLSSTDNRTVVQVTAVNSGHTRIEALSASGGRTALVDINVDIPAKDLSVKKDVYFGVQRGEKLSLSTGDFNFFSTATHVPSEYSKTTLNDVKYEIAGARLPDGTVEPNINFLGQYKPTVNGSMLSVPEGYPYNTVLIRPILSHLQVQTDVFSVYVFDKMPTSVNGSFSNRINVTNRTNGVNTPLVTGVKGVPFLDMVMNAPQAPAAPAVDPYPVKDIARLGISMTGADKYAAAPGSDWGYYIEKDYDINSLNIDDLGNSGIFTIKANNVGNIPVKIVLFPIAKDEFGQPIRFNYSYHSALKRTVNISIEVRNVFRENGLAFTKDGAVADVLNVFNSAQGYPPVMENFKIGILEDGSSTKLSAATINNPNNFPNNNYVYFYVKQVDRSGGVPVESDVYIDGTDGVPYRVGILDLFNVLYYGIGSQIGQDVKPTQVDTANPTGIPYSNMFSISVRNTAVLDGRELVLYVKSIHNDKAFARIQLTCVQAIGEIETLRQDAVYEETSPETWQVVPGVWQVGEKISVINPVLGGSPIQFFVETDEKHVIGQLDIKFNGEGADSLNGWTGATKYSTIGGNHFELGYSRWVEPAIGQGEELVEEFKEIFRVYQLPWRLEDGNVSGDGKVSRFEFSVVNDNKSLITESLNYSFRIVHPSRVFTTLNVIPLPVWEREPSVDLTEASGDVIYRKALPHETAGGLGVLVGFVRLGGTYGLGVRTYPSASYTGFNVVEYVPRVGGWEASTMPSGLSVISNELNRKLIRAEEEGVYSFNIKVHAQNSEITGPFTGVYQIRIVVVDPVVSAEIDPNGVEVFSKRSLGYDLALGLDQGKSKVDFDVVLGYASGNQSADVYGTEFRKSTIIDFSFQDMRIIETKVYQFSDTTLANHRYSTVRGASDAFEITREGTNGNFTNSFTLQGLRPTGNQVAINFKIRQIYQLGDIVVPIEFSLGGSIGGMNVSLFAKVVDAVMIKSIIPYDLQGDVLDITLGAPTVTVPDRGSPVSASVRTTINPANPYDNGGIGYLGYGFLRIVGSGQNQRYELCNDFVSSGGSRWSRIRNDYGSELQQEVIRVNVLTGEIIASRQNITTMQNIILVIYALDSVQPGLFPTTYALIPIYIYDKSAAFNQRIISNVEQFLEAFYVRNNTSYSYLENAKLDRTRGLYLIPRTNLGNTDSTCYFQLAADIDLSYRENGSTKYLALPPIPNFGQSSSAVLTGVRSYTIAGGIKNVNYSISNFRMSSTSQYYLGEYEDIQQTIRVGNYGFFATVGKFGIVEGVNFTDANGFISMLVNLHEARFGVVAAVNNGTIRDVTVSLKSSGDEFIIQGGAASEAVPGLYNIGLIVGRNNAGGVIEETLRGQIQASGLLQFNMHNTRLSPINFGGVAGLNNGSIIKAAGVAALRENIVTNSDASLLVVGGGQTFTQFGYSNSLAHGPNYYVNVGGIAGKNTGEVDGYTSESVIVNSAYGNSGGIVGYNIGQRNASGSIQTVNGVEQGAVRNSFSNSVVYARAAMGGVVGRNYVGEIDNCYYDLYLNPRANSKLWEVLRLSGLSASNWGAEKLYAGLIVGTNGTNTPDYNFVDPNFNPGYVIGGSLITYRSSPTVVGGVVGVNDSGGVKFSFASSAFTNEFNNVEMLDNMPYRGDVYVYNANFIVVGGVVGRQDNTVAGTIGRSEILGCYSTLTVFYDAYTRSNGAPKIGGIIGYLNNANADVNYCYSNMKINIVRDTSLNSDKLTYSGFWAHGHMSGDSGLSGWTWFNNCYSVVDEKTVVGVHDAGDFSNPYDPFVDPVVIDPIYFYLYGPGNITFTNSAVVSPYGSSVQHSGTQVYPSAAALKTAYNRSSGDPLRWNSHQYFTYYETDENLFPYPLVFDGVDSLNPLVMASPSSITPKLKTVAQYAEIYGNSKNNLGGYNYVIPNAAGTRAALFYNEGVTVPSAVSANRYYFSDLFTPVVDPEIASKRIAYKIEGPLSLVEDGIELDANGQPRYFVDIKGSGTFDIVMTSTRFVERAGQFILATNRMSFDCVAGINEMTLLASAAGLAGQKSLLNGDVMNITNAKFNVQKNTPFVLSGYTDKNLVWDIKMFGGQALHSVTGQPLGITQVSANGGAYQPLDLITYEQNISVPGSLTPIKIITGLSGTPYQNNTSFTVNEIGQMEFAVVPYITVGSVEYICYALAFKVGITVFGGAIELEFDQSVNINNNSGSSIIGGNAIDPSTGTVARGFFTTDIELPAWTGTTSDEEKVLDLLEFRYAIQKNQRIERLFEDYKDNLSLGLPISTTVNKVGGQYINLNFEFHVEKVEEISEFAGMNVTGAGYFRYHFVILMSVIVDEEGELYDKITQDGVKIPLVALSETVHGMISAQEILMSEYIDARERTDSVNIDIIAQDLQHAEIQHFSNARRVADSNGVMTENMSVDESQHASNNIFTDTERGGLLKVYAVPYFANINSFTLRHNKGDENRDNKDKPWMQLVGYTPSKGGFNEKPEPIYEEWSIHFAQMVYDLDSKLYVPLDVLTGEEFHQVSTTWISGGVRYYGWTGVYYIQTRLYEPKWRSIGERGEKQAINSATVNISPGKTFEIIAEFTTNDGRSLKQPFTVFTSEVPGLYFNYGNSLERVTTSKAEQAIGTEVPFTVTGIPAGKISITRRHVFIDKREVEVAEDAQNGVALPNLDALTGLVKTTFDAVKQEYKLWISPEYFTKAGKTSRIEIKFDYSREEDHGGSVADSAVLEITPVLFKIKGFTMDGWSGNTKQLTNPNRENLTLGIISAHSSDASLQAEIAAALGKLRFEINQGKDRDLLLWLSEGIKLNTNLGADGYYANGANVNFFLGELGNNAKFLIDAVGTDATSTFHVEMYFAYDVSGVPVILPSTGAGAKRVASTFNVVTVKQSSEDTPYAIYQNNVDLLRSMLPDYHYVIMEDLVLSNWTPVPFRAASLDGNNKKITINSFNFNSMPKDIGLFSTVGMDDSGNVLGGSFVLKNINIALPNASDSLDIVLSSVSYNVQEMGNDNRIRVGLLAGRNAGVITNCAVLNQAQFINGASSYYDTAAGKDIVYDGYIDYDHSTFNKTAGNGAQQLKVFVGNRNLDVRVGGLVGENLARGVISNSRVMIDIVTSGYQQGTGEVNVANMNLAGFVAENHGRIVSSFYRDGNITNNVSATTQNLTAGFVGINHNGASISTSYAMGVADDIDFQAGRRGCVIYGEISSNGTVAGFVQTNSGAIDNCFVNVIITKSSTASGFVMLNNSNGTIKNCFVNNARTSGITYYAFANNSNGMTSPSVIESNILNCKYVVRSTGQAFDGRISAFEVNETFITHSDNFNQMSVSQFDSFSVDWYADGSDAVTVWRMRLIKNNFGTIVGSMPELVSSNDIAVSIRILEPKINAQNSSIFSYVINPIGSRKNPVLVTSGEQFNNYVYSRGGAQMRDLTIADIIDFEQNIFGENMRLVNNIDLRRKSAGGDLSDTSAGILTYGTIFKGAVLDGNGLSINGISFNANAAVNRGLRSVGLFSKLEYATVKNVTLNFIQLGTGGVSIEGASATYVGGLAGVSINSTVSDVNIVGGSVIQGRSVVGGLVGIAAVFDTADEQTSSRIQNVAANVPVRASLRTDTPIINIGFESADEYIANDYYDVSIAGGVIGIVTGSPNADHWILVDGSTEQTVEIDILRKDKNGNVRTDTVAPQNVEIHVRNIKNYGGGYMTVTGELIGGLIGAVDSGIVVDSAKYVATVSGNATALTGKFYVGGIVGANLGTLRNSNITLPQGMNLQSMAASNYIFHSQEVVQYYGPGTNDFIKIYNNYHGMTVGGAVGFNRGIVDTVSAAVTLAAANFLNVWQLGGLVGENMGVSGVIGKVWNGTMLGSDKVYVDANGGTIRNSSYGGTSIGINGGFYIGGLVGVNHGSGTVIANNNVVLAGASWGANFSGTMSETSIFRTTTNATYDIITGAVGTGPVFLIKDASGNWIYNRTYFTGAFIGKNLDTGLASSVIDTNTGHTTLTGQRKVGLYVAS